MRLYVIKVWSQMKICFWQRIKFNESQIERAFFEYKILIGQQWYEATGNNNDRTSVLNVVNVAKFYLNWLKWSTHLIYTHNFTWITISVKFQRDELFIWFEFSWFWQFINNHKLNLSLYAYSVWTSNFKIMYSVSS